MSSKYVKDKITQETYYCYTNTHASSIIDALCDVFGTEFVKDKANYPILDKYITNNLDIVGATSKCETIHELDQPLIKSRIRLLENHSEEAKVNHNVPKYIVDKLLRARKLNFKSQEIMNEVINFLENKGVNIFSGDGGCNSDDIQEMISCFVSYGDDDIEDVVKQMRKMIGGVKHGKQPSE